MAKNEDVKNGIIFPVGDKNEAYADVFTGQSFLKMLVNDPEVSVAVGNVTFEPGCRNNWHVHTDGYQILLVTGGEGWYQEEGEAARKLLPGDVVVTHKGIKHWQSCDYHWSVQRYWRSDCSLIGEGGRKISFSS